MRQTLLFWLMMLAALAVVGGDAPGPAGGQARAVASGLPAPVAFPAAPTPIYYFRDLLARPPAQRLQLLAARSETSRQFLQTKLAEYEALEPGEREVRLQTLELRWYLLPLMKLSPAQRTNQLALLPERIRPLVGQRLQLWSLLPPPLQKEVLENESVLRYFWSAEGSALTPGPTATNLPPSRQAALEQELARWKALPAETQRRVRANVQRVLELSPREKARILGNLSEPERRQIERTLQSFDRLSEEDRQSCLSGFSKFAALSAPERREFLRNAQLWQAMPPSERQLWREIVTRVSHARVNLLLTPPGRPGPAPAPTTAPAGATRATLTSPALTTN